MRTLGIENSTIEMTDPKKNNNERNQIIRKKPNLIIQQLVEKISVERETKKNPARKRSLPIVNKYFEPDFNAISCRMRVFQQAVKS